MEAGTTQKKLVGLSSKMYFSIRETKAYVETLQRILPASSRAFDAVDVFLLPDYVALPVVADQLRGTKIAHGGQNCFHKDSGAYTGEVSPAMLKDMGCSLVELGHPERRRIFHETDDDVAAKAAAVCRNDMAPLVCIGERASVSAKDAIDECARQVGAVQRAIPDDREVVFAYHPAWAEDAGVSVEAHHVLEVAGAIRALVRSRQGSTRIIYGGSAYSGPLEKLAEGLDGLLLGPSTHGPEQFAAVVNDVAAPTVARRSL